MTTPVGFPDHGGLDLKTGELMCYTTQEVQVLAVQHVLECLIVHAEVGGELEDATIHVI